MFERNDLIPLRQFAEAELRMLKTMLTTGINSPVTSSAGRLFDAVAAIIGLRQRATFEGQAAMELEFASGSGIQEAYNFELWTTTPVIFDWQMTITEILGQGQNVGVIAAKFHNTLVEVIVNLARIAKEKSIILTGGCFQNQYLLERTVGRLREEGFAPYWHRCIPPNDGGIALGQIVAALRTVEQPASLSPTSTAVSGSSAIETYHADRLETCSAAAEP